MKKLLASVLAATLIVLSPGIGLYEAVAQRFNAIGVNNGGTRLSIPATGRTGGIRTHSNLGGTHGSASLKSGLTSDVERVNGLETSEAATGVGSTSEDAYTSFVESSFRLQDSLQSAAEQPVETSVTSLNDYFERNQAPVLAPRARWQPKADGVGQSYKKPHSGRNAATSPTGRGLASNGAAPSYKGRGDTVVPSRVAKVAVGAAGVAAVGAGVAIGLTSAISVPTAVMFGGVAAVGVVGTYLLGRFLIGAGLALAGFGPIEFGAKESVILKTLAIGGVAAAVVGAAGIATFAVAALAGKVAATAGAAGVGAASLGLDNQANKDEKPSKWATAGAVALVVAGLTAVGAMVYGFASGLEQMLIEFEYNLRNPENYMWMGGAAGALGLGMSKVPSLPDPSELYEEALNYATQLAKREGLDMSNVLFSHVNASLDRRTLRMDFEFRIPSTKKGAHHEVTVLYSMNALGSLDEKDVLYRDVPDALSKAEFDVRLLHPQYFDMGAKIPVVTALRLAATEIQGFDAKAYSLGLVTEKESGDRDLHYVFYSDDGAVVRVNARTGATAVVAPSPSSSSAGASGQGQGVWQRITDWWSGRSAARAIAAALGKTPSDRLMVTEAQSIVQNEVWVAATNLGREAGQAQIVTSSLGRLGRVSVSVLIDGKWRHLRTLTSTLPSDPEVRDALRKTLSVLHATLEKELALGSAEAKAVAKLRIAELLGRLDDTSRPSASNGAAPEARRDGLTATEVIGKVLALALAMAPAAIAHYFLPAGSLLGYAVMAQSAPIALFALMPKTKSRALLMLPGIAGFAVAAAMIASGSWLIGLAAALNAAGSIHYSILSTRKGAEDDYRSEERGLVMYFSALLNAAGVAGYGAFSGWAAAGSLLGPAITFVLLAGNKAFDFNIKIFTSWGLGFARGAANAAVAVFIQSGRWWRDSVKSTGEQPWTNVFGYVPLGLYGLTEIVAFLPVGLASVIVYGTIAGFEKAFEDVLKDSYVHRVLAHYRNNIGACAPFAASKGSPSEKLLTLARVLWRNANFLTVPAGGVVIAAARVVQLVEFALGSAVGLTLGGVYALKQAVSAPAPEFKEYERDPKQEEVRSPNPPVAVLGRYVALAVSLIPAAAGYFTLGANPIMGAALLLTSAALTTNALFAKKEIRAIRLLPFFASVLMTVAVAAPLLPATWTIGAIVASLTGNLPTVGLVSIMMANSIGLAHLEIKKQEKDSSDRQARKAVTFFATLLFGMSPIALGYSAFAGLPAGAISTGLLAVMGAYAFKGLFWDGLTEGFGEGLGESFSKSFERTLWWHGLLKFWKGGSWVAVLGALPVFAFYAVEGVAAFAIGLVAAFLWAPLRALEGALDSAYKGSLAHRFIKAYNEFIAKSTETGGTLPTTSIYKLVKWLLEPPNILTVPSGLTVLLAGQSLQAIGTALGTLVGLAAGLVVAARAAARPGPGSDSTPPPAASNGAAPKLLTNTGGSVVVSLLVLGGAALAVVAATLGWFSHPYAVGLGLLNLATGVFALGAGLSTPERGSPSKISAFGFAAALGAAQAAFLALAPAAPLGMYLALGALPAAAFGLNMILESFQPKERSIVLGLGLFYGSTVTMIQSLGIIAYGLMLSAKGLFHSIYTLFANL